MRPPPIDLELGLEVYVTSTPPLEARLADRPSSLIVEEIPPKDLEVKGEGRYAIYLLEKRMMTTTRAVAKAARFLGAPRGIIGYAGLKDKDAVTRQLISVPVRLAGRLMENAGEKDLKLRLLGFSDKPLRRGMLEGNRFKLRLATPSPSKACMVFEELRAIGGIPGYYGYQRFGTRRPNTHRVGMMLHRRMWMNAVREIAGHPYPHEDARSREARMLFDEGLYGEALKKYPRSLTYERIIARLAAKGRSPIQVLRALPRRLLEFFLEAYASYLYNRILSRKLLETGGDPAATISGEAPETCSRGDVVRGACRPFLPVPGYRLGRLGVKGRVGEIVREVLAEEEVEPSCFKVEELGIRVKAYWRRSFAPFVEEALCIEGEGEATLSFALPRGMYASIVVREIAKKDPLRIGF